MPDLDSNDEFMKRPVLRVLSRLEIGRIRFPLRGGND